MSTPAPPPLVESGIEYRPHPVQLAFHSAPQANRWFCAGYGVGKTTVGVIEAFTYALVTHPGYVGIVAAPTYPLLMQAWFTEWAQWIPRDWWTLKQDPKKGDCLLLRTPTGETSTILLRSTSNPWSNEGVNAAWLVFDEAPRERSPSAYNVLQGRLRRGYPGRQRGTILTGPPQSINHWTATEYGAAPDPSVGRLPVGGGAGGWATREHALIQARTRDNPFLPPDYEGKLRARPGATKAWCKQYLDAEFGALEGQVYDMFDRAVHIVPGSSLAGRQWSLVVGGVDWGWAHPGVMLVAGVDSWGDIWVLAEEVHQGKVISESADGWGTVAARLRDRYRVDRWYCDPAQPQAIEVLQRALRRGRTSLCYAADNDVAEGIRRVAARLESAADSARDRGIRLVGRPRLYISDQCPRLIQCLTSYSRKRDRDGALTESPDKRDDDPADALRYLVMGATLG